MFDSLHRALVLMPSIEMKRNVNVDDKRQKFRSRTKRFETFLETKILFFSKNEWNLLGWKMAIFPAANMFSRPLISKNVRGATIRNMFLNWATLVQSPIHWIHPIEIKHTIVLVDWTFQNVPSWDSQLNGKDLLLWKCSDQFFCV